jgi:hypothetical protein
MFAFVRPIAKLVTSWNDTTPTHIAGASSWLAPIRRADCFPVPELAGRGYERVDHDIKGLRAAFERLEGGRDILHLQNASFAQQGLPTASSCTATSTGNNIIAFPEVGGLHHRYERRAA